ncbi:hypothetical protein B0H19DRAFT_1374383 [Mycena capillaripes]|nr:hypothetical protein B0H19DRAFT_1374383 [Mycena capillaripes]
MSGSLEKLILPIFVGTLFNWTLFGILLLEVGIYFSVFPKDPSHSKVLVASVLLLEIIATIAATRDSIRIFGISYGDMDILNEVGWAWFSTPIMGSIIAAIGQGYFGWRIHILSHNLYVPALIAAITTVQMAGGIWTGVVLCRAKTFANLQNRSLTPNAIWLVATSSCDVLIVASTVYYLLKSRTREFKSTNARILRIVMITMETGLLCALLAIIDLFLFTTYKGTAYHLSICVAISKAYSNSILAILNSRANIGHKSANEGTHNLNVSDLVFRSASSNRVPN